MNITFPSEMILDVPGMFRSEFAAKYYGYTDLHGILHGLPSGKRGTHNELERFTMLLMGKSTISMAIFNSYVKLPEGIDHIISIWLVVWNMASIFPIILGMSSTQLTHIFQRA